MSIPLIEACDFMQRVTRVPIHVLQTREDRERFRQQYRFHSMQTYLTPAGLDRLLKDTAENELTCLTDSLWMRYILGRSEGIPIIFGPYCTEVLTRNNLSLLMTNRELAGFPVQDFLAFRSRFPVLEEQQAIHTVRCILCAASGTESDMETRQIDFRQELEPEVVSGSPHRSYADLIEERYRTEQTFMEAVRQGDADTALQQYNSMEQSVAYLKREGVAVIAAQIGSAITQTTTRLAAVEAGLSASIADALTGEAMGEITRCNDVQRIKLRTQEMIRQFCEAVRDHRQLQYSKLTQNLLRYIEQHYAEELDNEQLAGELDTNIYYMIRKCREETGTTPQKLLRKTRMEHAARMLRESSRKIQDISMRVGLLDFNLFSKQFKSHYGCTPTEYREKNKL